MVSAKSHSEALTPSPSVHPLRHPEGTQPNARHCRPRACAQRMPTLSQNSSEVGGGFMTGREQTAGAQDQDLSSVEGYRRPPPEDEQKLVRPQAGRKGVGASRQS